MIVVGVKWITEANPNSNNKVKWCEVFSWTTVGEIPVEIRSFVESQSELNLDKTIDFLEPLIKEKFIRLSFDNFSYLNVEPQPKHIIISFVVNLILCIFMSVIVVNNNQSNNYYRRWRN